jgi:hypothetical protein
MKYAYGLFRWSSIYGSVSRKPVADISVDESFAV